METFKLMRSTQKTVDDLIASTYEHGFVTDIESDTVAPGLSEDTIRMISAKKSEPEWLLEARLKAYRHWLTMVDPELGARQASRDRFPGNFLLFRTEKKK